MNSIPVSTEADLESLTGERADLLKLLLERNVRCFSQFSCKNKHITL